MFIITVCLSGEVGPLGFLSLCLSLEYKVCALTNPAGCYLAQTGWKNGGSRIKCGKNTFLFSLKVSPLKLKNKINKKTSF